MRRDGASTPSRHQQLAESEMATGNVLRPRGGADLAERNQIKVEFQPFRMDELQKNLRGS